VVLLVLFNQYVIPSSTYISSLILSKQRLATLPASTLQDTYTCHDQLLCEVLIVCPDRHKMTTLTPALHMESYSPDDNRFDLRFVHPLYISRHYQFPYVHLGKLGRVRLLTIRCLQAFSLPELHMGVQENREEYCDTRRARKEDAGCCGEQERD
jgi:hypothetical protein